MARTAVYPYPCQGFRRICTAWSGTKGAERVTPYPKYTREQDARCKLTDLDIQRMRYLRGQGQSIRQIAGEMGVSHTAVLYWTNADYRRRKRAIDAKRRATPGAMSRAAKRKRTLMPSEMRRYYCERRLVRQEAKG